MKQILHLLLLILVGATPATARPPVIHVCPDGSGDFTAIQPAVDHAEDGMTVLVCPGEYVITEPIDFNRLHDRDDPSSPPVKDIVLRSVAGAEDTILRMSGQPLDSDRASVAIFENEETSDSVLEGFTLRGGKGTMHQFSREGGGVLCTNGSSPTIRGCVVAENSAHRGGGLFSGYWCHPRLIGCTFTGNSAAGGGAVSNEGPLTAAGCVFRGNSAGDTGGAVDVSSWASTFTNCLFTGNTATWGGAICVSWTSATKVNLVNCSMHRNRAHEYGGGICCSIEGGVSLTSSIAWGNQAAHGPQIALRDPDHGCASAVIAFSDVEGGLGGVYLLSASGVTWGEGNIDADPRFALAGHWNDSGTPDDSGDDVWVAGDYHLRGDSPCIDAATAEVAPTTDLEGSSRPCGAGFDIGAYEYRGGGCVEPTPFRRGNVNEDDQLDIADAIHTLFHLYLGGPAPSCQQSADVDDDGQVQVTDAVYLLAHLFAGGAQPPPPFEECGWDVTADALTCGSFAPCR